MAAARMHALALAATLFAAPAPALAAAVELQVMIPVANPRAGPIRVELHAESASWSGTGAPAQSVVAPVENGVATARFLLSQSRYAVMAYQDRNSDGRLDLLPFSFPTEPVGFSGGLRPWFGRPTWDQSDFGVVEGERTTVFVRLK
jgi:uncharacterized protein (DUF2141 family)